MSTYVIYTGTFTKQDGTIRTMRFIRSKDVPKSQFRTPAGATMNRNMREGYEVVYDIERRGFRAFNWNSAIGEVTSQETSFDF
tara:strand:+ start:103 stop:351 length:249 start_codon:yes stop_codon:yes gene_type:complete